MSLKKKIIGLLAKVEAGEYSNISLDELFRQQAFSRKEKNFITEVFYGVLRNKLYLDAMIEERAKKISKEWIRQLLRLSIYQLRFMKSDAKGLIFEATDLVKDKYGLTFSKFVHALLRNYERTWEESERRLKEEGREDLLYSYPLWFVKRIEEHFPESKEAVLESLKRVPTLSVRVNLQKYSCEEFEKYLEEKEIAVLKKVGTVYYVKAGQLLSSPEFQEGKFIVQDGASYLAAKNLEAKAGEKILDACSAPGGKSLVLAEDMQGEGEITALDIYPHKIKLIQENVKKMGYTNIQAVKMNARHVALQGKKFDRILVDAPCSGYGVLAKKPEALYSRKEENIESLVQLQREILEACSKVLEVGGSLVYSTCTILPEENEGNIAWFLERNPNFESLEVQIPENVAGHRDSFGGFSIDFQEEILDSFYIAKLRRKY